jgi:hypothetical protein
MRLYSSNDKPKDAALELVKTVDKTIEITAADKTELENIFKKQKFTSRFFLIGKNIWAFERALL